MTDVLVVGAGAAGLFAALAARGVLGPDGSVSSPPDGAPDVLLVDGQSQPGRKILIAGGGRCNVTNSNVTADDFWTERPRLVRNALRAFGSDQARRAFTELGVPLKVEPLGKVFPVSDRAHDVLDSLLGACARSGVRTEFGTPVNQVRATAAGWSVDGRAASRVVVATGGRSVPATGSTGFGLDLAARLGHTVTDCVPALAPLHGRADAGLAGITIPVILRVTTSDDREVARAAGSMLFTHKGVTGPVALDVSGEVERLLLAGSVPTVTADLWTLADPAGPFGPHLREPKLPGCSLADPPRAATVPEVDGMIAAEAEASPRQTVEALLTSRLPRRLAAVVAGTDGPIALGQLRKDVRRDLARRLSAWPVPVDSTGGYAKAEVTRGGVDIGELDRHTLESKRAPGLHLCGEVCDVTGRLGGFNFQWAWTSGWLAGHGAAEALTRPSG